MKLPKELTKEMLKAAETMFLAMAYEKSVREIVEPYQIKILKENQFKVTEEFKQRIEIEIVESPKDSYYMSETDFNTYLQLCHDEHIKRFEIDEFGCCPLLIAENNTLKAKWNLWDAFRPIHKISKDTYVKMDIEKQMVELMLKMCAPFIKTKDALSFLKAA